MLAAVLLPATAQSQRMLLNRNWLPAATGEEPLRISIWLTSPNLYEMFARGVVVARWNGAFLPVRMISSDWLSGLISMSLEIVVPPTLRTPGFVELVLWNREEQSPLPFRAWVSVIIPAQATAIEADPSNDRVVAAIAGGPSFDASIAIYRLSTGELIQNAALPSASRVLVFTPDTAYAWVLLDENHGTIARLHLASGQLDQHIRTSDRPPDSSFRLSAEIYRTDPRILIVAEGGVTRAYADGNPLPNAAPAPWRPPFVFDDRGRFVSLNGTACEIDAFAGFTNCTPLSPGRSLHVNGVWKGKVLSFNEVIDLATGETLHTFGVGGFRTSYLAESDLVVFRRYTELMIADADSMESLVRIEDLLPDSDTPARIWEPGWILARASQGILVGRLPHLGPKPQFRKSSIVHGATGKSGPIAPGQIITIFGRNLGPSEGAGAVREEGLRLATEVERTAVLFDGAPGPILYADHSQINTIVPSHLQGKASISVQVVRFGLPSARAVVDAVPHAPGLFQYEAHGKFYAAALTPEGAIQGPGQPLRRNAPAVFYATGLGLPVGMPAEAVAARPLEVPSRPLVTIGGRPAQILYAGAAPGQVAGLIQLNVVVPVDTLSGTQEVVIAMGEMSHEGVWVEVE